MNFTETSAALIFSNDQESEENSGDAEIVASDPMPLTHELFNSHKSVLFILASLHVLVFYLHVYRQAMWKFAENNNDPQIIEQEEDASPVNKAG